MALTQDRQDVNETSVFHHSKHNLFENSVDETLLPAYHSPRRPSYLGIFNLAQPPTWASTIPTIFYGTYPLVAILLFYHIFQCLPQHRAQSLVYLEVDHGFDPVEERHSKTRRATDSGYEDI
jgi:hypothetical protein